MINSRLPAAMTLLAYLAAGLALSVSWAQLRQVLQMQGGLPSGQYISFALPLAILFGSCVLWRMLGHLFNRAAKARSFGAALVFVLVGAICNEGVSVFTSAMSLSMGVNHRIAQDVQQSDQGRAAAAVSSATTLAAERLANNIANMPERYYKRGNETAEQLQELIAAQTALNQSATGTSVTEQTLQSFGASIGWTADQLQTRWAWLLAGCLSLIVLAVQIGLGSLSDGVLAERSQRGLFFNATGAEEGAEPVKKKSGLSVVQ
jgi:hypothetical protein